MVALPLMAQEVETLFSNEQPLVPTSLVRRNTLPQRMGDWVEHLLDDALVDQLAHYRVH